LRRKQPRERSAREKSVADIRVELGSAVLLKLGPYIALSERSTIRSIGGHRVDRVGELDDARA
jgi:hypothetical protein